MSRKRRRGIKSSTVKQTDGGMGKEIALIIVAAGLALIPFVYGKYYEFGTNGAFDGGMNVYSAQCIVGGQPFGVKVTHSSRPGTLLVNSIGVGLFGYSEVGPKLIQMLMQLGALVLMFYTVRKVYGVWAGSVALILGAFYLSCPPFAKFGNVKEQYMIACMVMAACGLMLRHIGGSWWWLVVSGGFAVNIYFFKPTGVSVIIAMMIYLLAQPVLGHRSWRQFGSDIFGLSVGAVIGIVPLVVFYAWQGKLLEFVKNVPLVGYVVKTIESAMHESKPKPKLSSIVTGGGYVKGSKMVTVFSTQYDWVIKYYLSFVVPIGFSLLAIFGRIGRGVGCLVGRCKKTEGQAQDKPGGEQDSSHSRAEGFVLLLGIWWILDLLFVWISPRSYVEYYLPLNASAAMLAGYALDRFRRNCSGLVWLLGVWVLVHLFLSWVLLFGEFPYIGLRSSAQVGKYWGVFFVRLIPLFVGVLVYFVMKKPGLKTVRAVILVLLCFVMFFWWNGGNLKLFRQKITKLSEDRRAGNVSQWEMIGRYIRQNSSEGQGLYVWGWIPGIYVQAQRYSPARKAGFSTMHTDKPESLKRTIKQLLREFEANRPRYIVDTQKIEFPYYDHPVFDLWPRWYDKNKRLFFMRRYPNEFSINKEPVSYDEMASSGDLIYRQVEKYSYDLLKSPKRKGGAMAEDEARRLAKLERARHEAMKPLREFVMANYRLVPSLRTSMYVFELKDGDGLPKR